MSRRKKLKTFEKDVGTKTVRKELGCGKNKSKSRTGRTGSISQKSISKNSRSRKDILTISNECKPKSFSVRGLYKFFIGDF